MVIDEAAHVHKDTFFRVILPVVHVKNTVLICITSPEDENNWFSQVISYKDEDGKPLVFSAKFTHICERCAKLDPTKWRLCTHGSGANPTFKNRESNRKWGKVYRLAGNADADLRENFGVITAVGEPCFQREKIERAFDARRYIMEDPAMTAADREIPCIFACIDPNGGGSNNSAIVIGYRNLRTQRVVVCWADRTPTKGLNAFREFVRRNVVGFRKKFTQFKNERMVVCTESNARFDGDYVHDVLCPDGIFLGDDVGRDLIGEVKFMSDNGKRDGITKTAKRTQHYILHTSNHLETDSLRIHKNISTGNTKETPGKILEEMTEELKRFKWPELDVHNPRYSSSSKVNISGKFNGQSDDMAIALFMLIYFSFHYTKSQEQYEKFLEKMVNNEKFNGTIYAF